jgi:plasmid stability protein
MPEELVIENIPDDTAALLEFRARTNRRSLEAEVLAIFEDAVRGNRQMPLDEADRR